jgi:hypothetical protein
MAEIALGYGSEYQLFRFLGHHRNYLNKEIANVITPNSEIYWLDYPPNYGRFSLDGEFKDVECFNNQNITAQWKEYWPQRGNSQNWDGIFKVNDTWYFVEAKAHDSEVKSSCGATSESSKSKIRKAFDETISFVKSTKTADYWISKDCKSYQLANRLAFINFCNKNQIRAKLVYINFINGYDKPGTGGTLNVKSKEDWNSIWEKEYEDLGISREQINGILYHVYIDCSAKEL